MSYFSDHLAWQQRVAQEFKAQSSSLDNQMYQANGQWLNYPDLVAYLKTQQRAGKGPNPNQARSFGQQLGGILQAQGSVPAGRLLSPKARNDYADTDSQYAYAAKSKLLYPRKTPSQRSKTGGKTGSRQLQRAEVGPYLGETGETASQLNRKAIKRFNEEIPEGGPRSVTGRSALSKQNLARSQVGSQASKAKSVAKSQYSTYSKQQQKMQIYQNVEQLDDLQIDQISNIISRKKPGVIENPYENVVDEGEEQVEEQADAVEELPLPGESASQVQPTPSQLSKMSGKTYISQLQKQLDDEKQARQKLEGELEELKKISSEITSQLSQIQKQAQQ